jgi:hypothetical protein
MPLPDMPARGGALPGQAHGMKPVAAGLAAIAFVALMPSAAPAGSSMLGKWEIVEAVPGPWTDPDRQAALVAEGKRMLKLVITFGPKDLKSSHKLYTCKRGVIYEPNDLEVDSIFDGNLPEPNPAAAGARLGFPRTGIKGVDVRCLKARFTFHFRDPDTAMTTLNNVIYTLKRR